MILKKKGYFDYEKYDPVLVALATLLVTGKKDLFEDHLDEVRSRELTVHLYVCDYADRLVETFHREIYIHSSKLFTAENELSMSDLRVFVSIKQILSKNVGLPNSVLKNLRI